MSVQRSIGQLQVKSRFKLLAVLDCTIHSKYGEHTRAEITGTVKSAEAMAALNNTSEDKLEITGRDDDGVEEVLFTGAIKCAELKQEGQYGILTVRAVSNTWKMDIERKSRSFQDVSMTYKDVAGKVIQEYGAVMSWNLLNKPLEHPLIQYKETDYCFLKRILSHLEGSITTTDTGEDISLSAGLKEGSHIAEIDLKGKAYSVVLFHDKKIPGYRIENTDFTRVGDVLTVQGRTYYVMETEAKFINNVLNCTCLMFPKQCFETERMPAVTLRSAVLTGKVLKAEQEKVKLHLDIDKEQDIDGAFEFPWKPITGNLFYGMPEEGSKAALYFGADEEKNAAVIYNIRENGEECDETADFNNRYFTTQHEKRMYLKPSETGFVNLADQNAQISLKDDSGLEIKSTHKISILAEGQIELKGKNVKMTAPKEATLVKKDIMSPTVINLCNAFDAIGATGDFTAVPKTVKEKRKKAAGGQPMERYSLDGAVSAVLSNIPAAEMGSAVMDAVAGSMPVISRNIR